jgi:hypothetical protein
LGSGQRRVQRCAATAQQERHRPSSAHQPAATAVADSTPWQAHRVSTAAPGTTVPLLGCRRLPRRCSAMRDSGLTLEHRSAPIVWPAHRHQRARVCVRRAARGSMHSPGRCAATAARDTTAVPVQSQQPRARAQRVGTHYRVQRRAVHVRLGSRVLSRPRMRPRSAVRPDTTVRRAQATLPLSRATPHLWHPRRGGVAPSLMVSPLAVTVARRHPRR